jgi:hypothetical protein
MRTLIDPPSSQGGNAATGLIFVGVVLTVLFAAGIAAVVASRPGQPPGPAAQRPAGGSLGSSGRVANPVSLRQEAGARLAELVRLRDTALGRRDPALLARVYAPGCVNRRYDQAAINQLRTGHLRWLGLRSTLEVLRATQTGERQWTLVATVSRAAARLVTDGGRQVRVAPAQRHLLRFTMLRLPDGRNWALLGIATNGA